MWSAVVGGNAAAGIAGAAIQANATGKAAGQQSAAAQAGINETQREFNLSRMDLAPYRDTGAAAVTALGGLLGLGSQMDDAAKLGVPNVGGYIPLGRIGSAPPVGTITENPNGGYQKLVSQGGGTDENGNVTPGKPAWVAMPSDYTPPTSSAGAGGGVTSSPLTRTFTMDDFNSDPVTKASFDFGMSEGEKAVQRMFGSRGLSRSGAAVKAATRFATDYTGTQAGASRDRFVQDQTNLYNKLAGVAGTGQQATTTGTSAAMTTGANTAALLTGEGNARGAATIATANAYGGALNNIGQSASSAYWLNRAFPATTTPPSTPAAPSFYLQE